MTWQEPKTDWKAGDCPSSDDFNRIEGNVNWLHFNAVPKGIIAMWSGSISKLPVGWAICNGENETPDLRDKFIVGAGSEYTIGEKGGKKLVSLDIQQIPSHSHDKGNLITTEGGVHRHSMSDAGGHSHHIEDGDGHRVDDMGLFERGRGMLISYISQKTDVSGKHHHYVQNSEAHSHSISGSTGKKGGGQSHENRPPYFALAYIMKL